MAGRKDKNVVDYFPHQCEHGRTIFILEKKYSHMGYSVWFKTLELLGKNENHYIDCRKAEDWEYITALMSATNEELMAIYNTCATLDAIHPELWENKIIWSGNFIRGIADVYRRRENKCMSFPKLCEHLDVNCRKEYNNYGISVNINGANDNQNT